VTVQQDPRVLRRDERLRAQVRCAREEDVQKRERERETSEEEERVRDALKEQAFRPYVNEVEQLKAPFQTRAHVRFFFSPSD